MKLSDESADLIFCGKIPWDVVEYMAVATRVEETCSGDFLTECTWIPVTPGETLRLHW